MKSSFLRYVVSAIFLVTLSACGTLDYRQVQSDFASAVAADNQWSVSPFGANASEGLYIGVESELSRENIEKLDARLRANAWLLRAVSEWRLGKYTEAHASAAAGLREIQPAQEGSRDHIMLSMLDGLIIDSELRAKYNPKESLGLEAYERDFSSDFATGLVQLDRGLTAAGDATPPEIVWYYRYHRWRILNNWGLVISRIEPQADRRTARSAAESVVGGKLTEAAKREYLEIPRQHPLAELIRVQDPEVDNP